MKRLFNIQRLTTVSLALMLTAGVIVVSEIACTTTARPGCGNKRQHKARKKQVRRMAPSMGG